MIKWILIAVVAIVSLIISISLFLSVDSLGRCGDTPSDMTGCRSADVIIAVSGGDTRSRTQQAIDLYKNGWAPKLVFSGAAYDKTGPSNAEVMRKQAIDQRVPAEDIIIESDSETTRENAGLTAKILEDSAVESAIVVTSAYHQKRTLLEFNQQSPSINFRTQPPASDNQWSVWWWTTPYGWYLAISEVLKIGLFYLGGTR